MAIFEKEKTDSITISTGRSELVAMAEDARSQSEMVRKNVSELYSNRHSPFREIISNGLDAYGDAVKQGLISGKGPKVQVSYIQQGYFGAPELKIRDFGTGMSEETIYGLYRYFGTSNRDKTNDAIGGYGIGSKSPLKITPQFIVKTDDGKEENIVNVGLDKDNLYRITTISQKSSSGQRGTEVSIPLKEINTSLSKDYGNSYYRTRAWEQGSFSIGSIASFIEDVFVLPIAKGEIVVKNLPVTKYTIKEETDDYVLFKESQAPHQGVFLGPLYYNEGTNDALVKLKSGIEAKPNLAREKLATDYIGSSKKSFYNIVAEKTKKYQTAVEKYFFDDIAQSDISVFESYHNSKNPAIRRLLSDYSSAIYSVMDYEKGYRARSPQRCIRRMGAFIADPHYSSRMITPKCYFEGSLSVVNVMAWLETTSQFHAVNINDIGNDKIKEFVKRSLPNVTTKKTNKTYTTSKTRASDEIPCKLLIRGTSWNWENEVTFEMYTLKESVLKDLNNPDEFPYKILKCKYEDQSKLNQYAKYVNMLTGTIAPDGRKIRVLKLSNVNYEKVDAVDVFDTSVVRYIANLYHQHITYRPWTQALDVFKPLHDEIETEQKKLGLYFGNQETVLAKLQGKTLDNSISKDVKERVEKYKELKKKYYLLEKIFYQNSRGWGNILNDVNKLVKHGF